MTTLKSPKKVYICCRYCMEKNSELLIPCAKYRDGTDYNLEVCPKKEKQDLLGRLYNAESSIKVHHPQ